MENNEIMERLLQDDKDTSVKEEKAAAKSQNGEIQISRIRIISAKYKVYIILLAIFICLLGLVYIPDEDKALKANSSSYEQVNAQLTRLKADIKAAEKDMEYLCDKKDGIVSNEENLKNCLNNREGCTNLPDSWKEGTEEDVHYNLSVPLSYLQANSLFNEKMPVDEKRVLKNLNEYLIKQDILGNDKKKVGDILRIEIGDPEIIGYGLKKDANGNEERAPNFFEVPLDVEIKFDTVGDLTGFLYNVEKKIVNNREDRILYKIQSVSYDVVSNNEPQDADISMIAYYYYDKDIDILRECGNNPENPQGSNTQDDEEIAGDDGFFQKIINYFK